MYPTLILGFATLAMTTLALFRKEKRHDRAARALSSTCWYSGVLGTCVGIANTAHYIETQPVEKKFELFAMGLGESVHVVILAGILVTLAGILRSVATFRMRDS